MTQIIDLIHLVQNAAPFFTSIFSIIGIILGAFFHMRSTKKFELDKTIEAFDAIKDELASMQKDGKFKDLKEGVEKGVKLAQIHRLKKKLPKKSENKLISRLRGFFLKKGLSE